MLHCEGFKVCMTDVWTTEFGSGTGVACSAVLEIQTESYQYAVWRGCSVAVPESCGSGKAADQSLCVVFDVKTWRREWLINLFTSGLPLVEYRARIEPVT